MASIDYHDPRLARSVVELEEKSRMRVEAPSLPNRLSRYVLCLEGVETVLALPHCLWHQRRDALHYENAAVPIAVG